MSIIPAAQKNNAMAITYGQFARANNQLICQEYLI